MNDPIHDEKHNFCIVIYPDKGATYFPVENVCFQYVCCDQDDESL